VVGNDGSMKYYCSHCGEPTKFPIDGICKGDSDKAGNTCTNGVCTQCADGYFLYMGGCYSVSKEPGSLMCTAAEGGICTTPTGQYFKVPGATAGQQSVLACENPVGTAVGERAYVGVEGCKTCTAPSEAPSGAMAPARCTACGSSKKPSLLGSGCFTCAMDGCSHCSADGVCEACTSAEQRPSTDGKQCIPCNISGCTRCSEASKCSQCGDGYRLESDTCVSTGGGSNLSSGAIAGISVAVIAVVGGLVGFLCWWFICRGKA
ncbi:Variant-specific surface protein, partial [Giardia duodenalis]